MNFMFLITLYICYCAASPIQLINNDERSPVIDDSFLQEDEFISVKRVVREDEPGVTKVTDELPGEDSTTDVSTSPSSIPEDLVQDPAETDTLTTVNEEVTEEKTTLSDNSTTATSESDLSSVSATELSPSTDVTQDNSETFSSNTTDDGTNPIVDDLNTTEIEAISEEDYSDDYDGEPEPTTSTYISPVDTASETDVSGSGSGTDVVESVSEGKVTKTETNKEDNTEYSTDFTTETSSEGTATSDVTSPTIMSSSCTIHSNEWNLLISFPNIGDIKLNYYGAILAVSLLAYLSR